MLVNSNNFFIWDDGTGINPDESDLPKGYVRDNAHCDHRLIIVHDEVTRFYINSLDGFTFPSFGSIKLGLYNRKTGVQVDADISPLQQDIFNNPNYNIYCALVIPNTIPEGVYFLKIYNGGTTYLTSNSFRIVSATSHYLNSSSVFSFRHDRAFYGFNYQNLIGFYQRFRLQVNQVGMPQYDNDREVYNEVTTGKQRTFNSSMKRMVKLETYYFDQNAHDAAAVMFEHNELMINGKDYKPKGNYKPDEAPMSKTSKGEIEVYDQGFATANRCGNANTACYLVEATTITIEEGTYTPGDPVEYDFVIVYSNGIPTANPLLEYSLDGTTWLPVTSFVFSDVYSGSYNIGLTDPTEHELRITPKCADGTSGIDGEETFTP